MTHIIEKGIYIYTYSIYFNIFILAFLHPPTFDIQSFTASRDLLSKESVEVSLSCFDPCGPHEELVNTAAG